MIGLTCGTCRLHFFRRRATGAASARPSLRPPRDEGEISGIARARRASRECGCSSLAYHDMLFEIVDQRRGGRLTCRFAPREATLPLQGRVEFAIGRGAKRSE